jgi:hypothetical protein
MAVQPEIRFKRHVLVESKDMDLAMMSEAELKTSFLGVGLV